MLYWVDVTTNYEVVLHLFFPEVEVHPLELPNAHFG
jgi:hypothetical protein